jgi:hypothetical protein
MSTRLAGSVTGTALVLQPGFPERERDDQGNWMLVFEYVCRADSADGLIPAHLASPPSPWNGGDYAMLKLRGVKILSTPTGDVVRVRLEYRLGTVSSSLAPGDTRRSAQQTSQERTIDEHPTMTAAQKVAAKAKGRTSYLQRSIAYRYEERHSSYTWSQANIIASVGSTGAPTGMTSATAANWLQTAHELSEDDAGTTEITTWEYDQNGWQPGTH